MLILPDVAESHARSASVIDEGGIVAFRTDTFYGLGVDPLNTRAIRALNDLKGRDGKPILVVVSDPEKVGLLVHTTSNVFNHLAKSFWPGPLTLIAEAKDSVPDELTASTKKIGVRLPADERVRQFVRACGGALTATSANPAGESPARSAAEVSEYFADSALVVIDGGETTETKPSTVVDASGDTALLIREGVVGSELLAHALSAIGARIES